MNEIAQGPRKPKRSQTKEATSFRCSDCYHNSCGPVSFVICSNLKSDTSNSIWGISRHARTCKLSGKALLNLVSKSKQTPKNSNYFKEIAKFSKQNKNNPQNLESSILPAETRIPSSLPPIPGSDEDLRRKKLENKEKLGLIQILERGAWIGLAVLILIEVYIHVFWLKDVFPVKDS
eukprot:jgi/Galph1/3946/GphlegSOOS_G2636.1